MQNMRITISCGTTIWEFIVEAKRAGDMIAAGIEKMEEEYGEGALVTITAQATNETVNI